MKDVSQRPPGTVWLTGLSGSGKSTISVELRSYIGSRLGLPVLLLDGDSLRGGLCRDLGFSDQCRQENVRRAAEVARLANAQNMWVIAALITPTAALRAMARDIVGGPRFHEVYLSTPLSICEGRDPKGLYRRARAGELQGFTGIDAPFDAPVFSMLELDTSRFSVDASVDLIVSAIGIE